LGQLQVLQIQEKQLHESEAPKNSDLRARSMDFVEHLKVCFKNPRPDPEL
jgi:hypothetical protein